MELFTQLFGKLLVFVYHCFDRIVIHGYLNGLSRPEQVVYFFRQAVGVAAVGKEVLRRRTDEYQQWVEAFARNHDTPIEWAKKKVRKDKYVEPWQRSMVQGNRYGVYFIFRRFVLFHQRLCGPLANSLFHHRPNPDFQPESRLEAAVHKADNSIRNVIQLLEGIQQC
jgi:hypothetical protein